MFFFLLLFKATFKFGDRGQELLLIFHSNFFSKFYRYIFLLFIDMNSHHHNFQTYQGFIAATLLHYYTSSY